MIIIYLCCIAIALCSCGSNNGSGGYKPEITGNHINENTKQGSDVDMTLATGQELLEYIKDNDIGLTEKDFEGIDIDDFIKHCYITSERLGRFNLKTLVKSYKDYNYHEQRAGIMAKEIISVDSTDEEYQAFVEAYLKELNKETLFIGTNNSMLLDVYTVIAEDARYRISIGKTKNMGKYDIRNDGLYGNCHLHIPEGDMTMITMYCYSADNKFFLVVSADKNDDFSHVLSELFVKLRLP